MTCLYFATDDPPDIGSLLMLNGDGRGPINNLCLPSNVCPSHAPPGQTLVSVTVLDSDEGSSLDAPVRAQARGWFGASVDRWEQIRAYEIPHALPIQTRIPLCDGEKGGLYSGTQQVESGLIVCGDHVSSGSLQGAMLSGRAAAERILASE